MSDAEHLIDTLIPFIGAQPERTDDAMMAMLHRLQQIGHLKAFRNAQWPACENQQVDIAVGPVVTPGFRTIEHHPLHRETVGEDLSRFRDGCSVIGGERQLSKVEPARHRDHRYRGKWVHSFSISMRMRGEQPCQRHFHNQSPLMSDLWATSPLSPQGLPKACGGFMRAGYRFSRPEGGIARELVGMALSCRAARRGGVW